MSHSNEFWNFGNADRSEDTPKGYFTPLFPHNLGRPLHHPEQDYNAHLISQIIKGYRVIGSGTDGVMTTDDLELGIKLHEVNSTDADYLHYIACGCKDEEWIWVPAEMGGTAVSPLSVNVTTMDGNPCVNADATISAQGTGGTPTYVMSLQTVPNVNPGNIQDWTGFGNWTQYNGINLSTSGQAYYVYVKDALNTVDVSDPIYLSEITAPIVTLSETQPVSQPGGIDGILLAEVTNDNGGSYTYSLYRGINPDASDLVESFGPTGPTRQFPINPNTPIGAGDYWVSVTDQTTQCVATDDATITQPASLTFTPIVNNAVCENYDHESVFNQQDSFTFDSPTGGTPGYEYSITNPNTDGYTWSTATTYSVPAGDQIIYPAIKDSTGFIYELPGGQPFYNPEEVTFIVTGIPATCSTGVGAIQFSQLEGGPVPLQWPNPQKWQFSIDGGTTWMPNQYWEETQPMDVYLYSATEGNYPDCQVRRVEVDANGNLITASCPTAPQSATIASAPGVSFNLTPTDDTECGLTGNGQLTVDTITVGGQNSSLNYSIKWEDINDANNSGIIQGLTEVDFPYIIQGLDGGTYEVTVTDTSVINGCDLTLQEIISEITSNLALTVDSVGTVCTGETVNINWSYTGGTGTVNIYDDQNIIVATSTLANDSGLFTVGEGTHIFTAIDDTLCEKLSMTVITAIPDPTITLTINDQPSCGSDGSISALVQGAVIPGGANPILLLTDPFGNTTISTPVMTFGNEILFGDLPGGTYTISITNDQCLSGVSEQITLTAATSITITEVITNVTCNGDDDGSITITVSGGTPEYGVQVNDSNGNGTTLNGTSGQTVFVFTGLAPDTYTILGGDANSCPISGSFTITEPDVLVVDNIQTYLGACWLPNSSSWVSIDFTGGTPDYTVDLYSDANVLIASQTGAGPQFTFGPSYNLATGDYYFIGTDDNGCTVQSAIFTIPPCAFAVTFDSVVNSTILCNGGNGTITATVSGGSGNYEFSMDGSTWDGPYIGDPYAYTFSGTYTGGTTLSLYVRDSIDLTAPVDTINYTMLHPAILTVTVDASVPETVAGSSDGSLSFSDIIGGTQPYSKLTLFDSTQTQVDLINTPLPATTYTFSNLSAGNYYVLITDANGCESDKIYAIVQNGSAPLSILSSSGNITCFGETTDVVTTVTGGSGTFRFSNDNGTNWTSYLTQTVYTFSNMGTGSHTIKVEDQNTYPNNVATEIITINQPSEVFAQFGSTNETIAGEEDGTISIQTSGGTPDYIVSIDGSSFGGLQDTITGTPGQTLFQWTNLAPGTYTYNAEDSNGCDVPGSVTISGGTPQINATALPGTIDCHGGTTDVVMTTADGSGDYQYAATPTIDATPPTNWNATTQATTYTWSTGAGVRYFWVKDAVTGTIRSVAHTLTQPNPISVSYSGAETYPGADDASIQIFISGGTSTYDATCVETSETLTGLVSSGTFTSITSAGTYNINITDANGCTKSSVLSVVTLFNNIVIDSVTSTPTCYGEADGIISFSASGGFGSTYEWSKDGGNTWTQDITFFDGLTGADYGIFLRDYSTGETLEWSSNPVTVVEADEIQVITSTMTDGTCNSYPEYYIKFSGSNLTMNDVTEQSVRLDWITGNTGGSVSQSEFISNLTSLPNNEFEGTLLNTSFGLLTSVNQAGSFNVTITSDGCEKTFGPFSYDTDDDITIGTTLVSQPECPTNDWVYNISATGGPSANYILATANGIIISGWDGAAQDFNIPQSASGNTTIYVSHTDWANNGCEENTTVTSTQLSAMSVSGSVNNPLCATGGGSTYSFTMTGGLPAGNTYKYKVSTDGGTTWNPEQSYTGAVSNQPISNGSITIKGYRIVNGNSTEDICDVEEILGTVTNPIALSGSINSAGNVDPTACSGAGATSGVISMTIAGGTGSYEFSYDGGSNYYVLTEVSSGIYEFTGLGAGTYAIVARDTNNCQAFTATVILVAPNSPTVQSHKVEGCWRDADGAQVETTVLASNNGTENASGLYNFTDITADAPTTNTTGVFTYSNSDMTTHVQSPITITNISTQCSYVMNTFSFNLIPSLSSEGVIGNFNNTPSGAATYDTDDFKVWNIGAGGNVGNGSPYTVQLIDSSGNVFGTINNATAGNNYIYDVPSGDYTYKIYDNGGTTGCGRTYTTPMTSTQQVLNEETFYHIHTGGGNVAPYGDLMSTTATWYTSAGTSTQDINTIMADMIDNGDGTTYPSGVTMPDVGTFEFAGPITGNNCGQTWTHNASSGQNYYYLTVPDNSSFSENLVTDGVFQYQCNGLTSYATARRAFTYNSENYWLYKLVPGTGAASNQYGFK